MKEVQYRNENVLLRGDQMAKIDSRLHSLQQSKFTNLSDVLTYYGIADKGFRFYSKSFSWTIFFYGQQLAHDKNKNTQTG